ncbi:hypothetical protein CRG98_008083, partial [Punica granatum]
MHTSCEDSDSCSTWPSGNTRGLEEAFTMRDAFYLFLEHTGMVLHLSAEPHNVCPQWQQKLIQYLSGIESQKSAPSSTDFQGKECVCGLRHPRSSVSRFLWDLHTALLPGIHSNKEKLKRIKFLKNLLGCALLCNSPDGIVNGVTTWQEGPTCLHVERRNCVELPLRRDDVACFSKVGALAAAMKLKLTPQLALAAALLLISSFASQIQASDVTFYESFDESFDGRWIVSGKEDYKGVWKRTKSEGHDDYGLLVSEKARKYAIVKELDEAVSLKDGTVVLQYE